MPRLSCGSVQPGSEAVAHRYAGGPLDKQAGSELRPPAGPLPGTARGIVGAVHVRDQSGTLVIATASPTLDSAITFNDPSVSRTTAAMPATSA